MAYVLKEKPHLLGQVAHSRVCSKDDEERWERCKRAVQTDACRHQGIHLSPTIRKLEKPQVYEVVRFGSYTDMVLGCTCPTEPKLILLTDAIGFSTGQVIVFIYEPKRTMKEQLDAYKNKFTDTVKYILPGDSKSENKSGAIERKLSLGDISPESSSSGSPIKASNASRTPTLKEQLGAYKGKLTDKVKDVLPGESKESRKSSSKESADVGLFGIPKPNTSLGDNSSSSASKQKKSFWERKKKSSANVGSESVQTVTRMQSFGDSRFGSFTAGGISEDESYNDDSDGVSPEHSYQWSEEELADFENPFAGTTIGQSQSSESQDLDETSRGESAVGPKEHNFRTKMKEKVKKLLQ